MGCITSKNAVSIRPTLDNNNSSNQRGLDLSKVNVGNSGRRRSGKEFERDCEFDDSWRRGPEVNGTRDLCLPLSNIHNYIEAEQVAAGWPSWISSVAAEAIQGLVPLQASEYKKMEMIGQGTYSEVFKTVHHDTGKMFAMKKVRFDSNEPESVKFMAREIQVLRRLNHPNVIGLEGVIVSQYVKTIYLVFEYMDHDIAGLISRHKFSEPQVKCYMRQLLSGLEHCHSKSVMHRDIKCANLLVNDSGCLKIADFGLARYYSSAQKQPLTSRVVTLWYRPPELILGSTNYEESVDLWSVGCVFAELFLRKPILDGRTEIEQLHRIFKLCGSPPEDYWKNIKMPNASVFKSRCHHEGNLKKICKDLPNYAVNLIEKLLSVNSKKRGTASDALHSLYFITKPYEANPSSLPKYPPTKEMDAQILNRAAQLLSDQRAAEEANSQAKDIYTKKPPHGCINFSGPLQIPSSSGFEWAKKTRESNAFIRPSYENSYYPLARNTVANSEDQHRNGSPRNKQLFLNREEPFGEKHAAFIQKMQSRRHADSFHNFDNGLKKKTDVNGVTNGMSSNSSDYHGDEESKVDFSGPLLCQTHEVNELLENHEQRIGKAMRKLLFKRCKSRVWKEDSFMLLTLFMYK